MKKPEGLSVQEIKVEGVENEEIWKIVGKNGRKKYREGERGRVEKMTWFETREKAHGI